MVALVADLQTDIGSGDPHELIALDGKLYFRADDGVHGLELWVYDPAAGAALVADIDPGAGYGSPSDLTVLDGKLYFSADDGTSGREVWVYDPVCAAPSAPASSGSTD